MEDTQLFSFARARRSPAELAVRARARLATAIDLAGRIVALERRAVADAIDYRDRLLPPLKERLTRVFGAGLADRTLVDFGCGYDYPLVCLLAPSVKEIVGVDVCPVYRRGELGPGLRGGLLAATKRLAAHELTTRVHDHIAALVGKPADGKPYRTMQSGDRDLPLPDGFADAVVSNAVLQELPLPLEDFAREMHRVLAPSGYVDLEWHNFYSLSGNYGDAERRRTQPWGHLLGGPVHPRLNRVRPEQVVAAFSPWFTDIRVLAHDARHRTAGEHPGYEEEGRDLLTPELAARLSRYPRSLLLTRGYVLVGRRRP